jgi:hypothetical protein
MLKVMISYLKNNMLILIKASVDGALSFWKVNYVSNDKLTAFCIFILKPRFIDEQASVTDLAWYLYF